MKGFPMSPRRAVLSLALAGTYGLGLAHAQDLPTMLRAGAVYSASNLTICMTHQDATGLLATFNDEIENRVVRRSGPPVRCETNVTARFTPIHTDLSLKGEERRLIPSLFGSQPCTPETPEKRCDNRLLEVTFIKAKLLSSDSEAQEAFILERSGTRVIDEAGRIVNGR
jgi:hypothetical protein